jgi:hypothetical protein
LGTNPLLTRTEPSTEVKTPASAAPTPEPAVTPVDPQARGRVDTSTSKFTFYFTDEELDRLDVVWQQLRRGSRRSGQRLTKSHVVRVALDRLLDEYDRDPERVISELKQQLSR